MPVLLYGNWLRTGTWPQHEGLALLLLALVALLLALLVVVPLMLPASQSRDDENFSKTNELFVVLEMCKFYVPF